MPIQVNVPPRVRFWLYIAGALASTAVSYLVDKAWAGDAEVRLVANLVALINVLAAAKTDLSDPPTETEDDYQGRHELEGGTH